MELDRMEEALVAPNAPKVGVSLEDMGMGGNKRTVFYNKNKKLVEIQASLTKNGFCFTPSTRYEKFFAILKMAETFATYRVPQNKKFQ